MNCVLEWFVGVLGLILFPRNPNCIYTERELRDAIDAGGTATLCQMCQESDIVKLTSEIDITGKSFEVNCLPNDHCIPSEKCVIQSANGDHRLFSGAPVSAKFSEIGFSYNQQDGDGGVFSLTGGSTTLEKCGFRYNTATNGGALFVSGANTRVTLIDTAESNANRATQDGGFLVATDGSTVVLDGTDPDSIGGIGSNWADDQGGFVVAKNGALVELRNMVVQCGNQATDGGDYLYIEDGAFVRCQNVEFDLLATSTMGEVPPPFNSTKGIIGSSDSCKGSKQVGDQPKCKRVVSANKER